MGEDPGAVSTRAVDESGVPPEQTTVGDAPAQSTPDNPAEMREEIERTRQDLGDTVAALAEKTDVKAQAKRKVQETKATVVDRKNELVGKAKEASPASASSAATQASQKARENPLPLAALGAFAAGFLAGRITKR